ncbi:hypothetical protein Lal_00011067 [Lupinus albus]|uniref:Putative ananain protein n=1 Tax=Lupinus albus TaxID=3870 RepID=A0A6A4PT05_LUPAL|nr:putative ananain protein [Lupinus albus]KAF1892600.1 hypothetical protein Lal_00011067 [Lupinus albus]
MTIAIEMKQLIFCVCVILCLYSYSAMSQTINESSVAKIHEQWMIQYERSYANDIEKEKRLKIFKENLEYIEKFNNNANKSYELGLNQFSDLTMDEFIASYTGHNKDVNISRQTSFSSKVVPLEEIKPIPGSIDWRQKGAVTKVKNQGSCGCCWAFSSIAAVEGFTKIKNGNLLSLSAQELVDCTSKGCSGASVIKGYKYIIEHHGIADENSYPYTETAGTCQTDKKPTSPISDFIIVPPNDEEQLLRAVSRQPVATSISIYGDFKYYKEGIYTGGSYGTDLTHSVTIVGYGTSQEGIQYWLVKNSWGEQWGEGGYMRLQRGIDDKRGLCGLAMWPAYPI